MTYFEKENRQPKKLLVAIRRNLPHKPKITPYLSSIIYNGLLPLYILQGKYRFQDILEIVNIVQKVHRCPDSLEESFLAQIEQCLFSNSNFDSSLTLVPSTEKMMDLQMKYVMHVLKKNYIDKIEEIISKHVPEVISSHFEQTKSSIIGEDSITRGKF